MRSEYGQPELTVYPDGNYEITDTPTISNLPKGTVIYNEEQTKKIINDKSHGQGKTYANGTIEYPDGTIVTPDGRTLRPLQPGDQGYDLMKAFEPLIARMQKGEEDILSNAVFEHQRQMEKWTKEITNNNAISNIVNNNRNIQPSINVGDINITCPGVTSWETMRQIKNQLDNEVRGLHNYADQMSRIR